MDRAISSESSNAALWISSLLSIPGITAGGHILYFHCWAQGNLSLGNPQGSIAFGATFWQIAIWGQASCLPSRRPSHSLWFGRQRGLSLWPS